MNEYTPIDLNDKYTDLPIFDPKNQTSSSNTVYFYNDTINKDDTNKIQPLSALMDNIDSRTAVFGDIIGAPEKKPTLKETTKDPNKVKTIIIPNSLDDNVSTKFFVGSLTVVGLYIF